MEVVTLVVVVLVVGRAVATGEVEKVVAVKVVAMGAVVKAVATVEVMAVVQVEVLAVVQVAGTAVVMAVVMVVVGMAAATAAMTAAAKLEAAGREVVKAVGQASWTDCSSPHSHSPGHSTLRKSTSSTRSHRSG